jgi:hypothetical protein
VLAHAFDPPSSGEGRVGGVHFDEDQHWTISIPVPSDGIDLITMAAHEFGHSLGLSHSTVPGALMYPIYGGPQRFLAADDIASIRAIYGAANHNSHSQLEVSPRHLNSDETKTIHKDVRQTL